MKSPNKNKTVTEPSKKKYQALFGNQFARKYTDDDIHRIGDELVLWFKNNPNNYYLKMFCVEKMINPQNISEWEAANKYFAYCLSIAKAIQEERIVRLGIKGNPAMPIFILKNVAGMRDTQDHKFEFPDGYEIVIGGKANKKKTQD